MKITKLARDCANDLKEVGFIKEGEVEEVAKVCQEYMIKYCSNLAEKVNNYESILFADKADNVIEGEDNIEG